MPIMAKSNDEYAEVKAIKTPDGTEIDYVLSKVDNTYKRTYTAMRELEDAPPLNFKSIKPNANLIDYRIYGQTVDGESVGDRTGNLFDENSLIGTSWYFDDEHYLVAVDQTSDNRPWGYNYSQLFITLQPGSYIFKMDGVAPNAPYAEMQIFGGVPFGKALTNISSFSTKISLSSITTLGFEIKLFEGKYRLSLTKGTTEPSEFEPYGYKVPVTITNGTDTLTTPIYLPEQIKKVGDEAEYIDFGQQKQHRVRKNLLKNKTISQTITGVTFTVNNDGSVTCNGTADSNSYLFIYFKYYFDNTEIQYKLTGCPEGGSRSTYLLEYSNGIDYARQDSGAGVTFYPYDKTRYPEAWVRIIIYSGYTCNNLTFYPMIRKASITDDTYEPYIENTDLDVTLPALPTLTGTNVLSVGTEVQPSDMYIKGNFKMIAGGGE